MKNKREEGAVVVEASIVVTIVVIVISLMFYIGMALYQQTAISVVANRTATNIAQVYSNTLKDPFTGYIDPDKAYQSITYGNMKTDAYIDSIQQKGNAFATYRLKKSQIIPALDREVEVELVNKPNEVLKSQVIVKVVDSYDIPLVGFFGTDGKIKFSSSGRADCVDYLEYLNGVEAIANPEESPIPSLPDSDTCIVTFVVDKYNGGFHAAVPVLRGKSIITSNKYSHSIMPKEPRLNNMKFTGWVTDDGKSFTATKQVDENLTVYASWQCTITFKPEGGKVSPETKTVEYYKTTTLPTPTRTGYAFEGWYTQKNGGGEKYTSGVTQIKGNVTLYAKWRCLHAKFTKNLVTAGTCKKSSVWLYDCDTCDYSYLQNGGYGSCEMDAKKTKTSPSCTTTGSYITNCKYCGRLMSSGTIKALGHKYAANGKDYDTPYTRAATCSKEGIRGSRCSRCGTEKGEIIDCLPHTWSGRCGKTHDISNNPLNMNFDPWDQSVPKPNPVHTTVAGYRYSTNVECYLCSVCAAPYNGWTYRTDVDGVAISWGVICRAHRQNGGYFTDDAYALSAHKNMHVHG